MASSASAQAVENIIAYKFQSKHDFLPKALTAAGAVEEDWDGNRKLALFGSALSEFLLHYLAFEAGITRAYASDFKSKVSSNEQRAFVARQTGISRHIRFNEREGAQSPSVLAKAVNAIIGVVFLDCGGDINVVLRTMRHLGLFTCAGQSIDPTLLSLDEFSESIDVASLARSLFRADGGRYSPSITSSNDQNTSMSSSITLPRTTGLLPGFENGAGPSSNPDDYSYLTGELNVDSIEDRSPNNNLQIVRPVANGGDDASWCDTNSTARRPQKPPEKQSRVHWDESGQRKKRRECSTRARVDGSGSHLDEEVRKCQVFGVRPPQDTFLTLDVQEKVQELGKEKTEVLTKILVHIASPCLIGGLQEILESCRTQKRCPALETTSPLSTARRFHLIAVLGQEISHSQFLRRYHVLRLFMDCGGLETSVCEVIMTPANFAGPSNKRGNPVNRSVADVTTKMIAEIFPEIIYQTSEYRAKYRWITDVRRLGKRLHLLETKFGQGVLGLILDQGIAGTDTGITDAMIMLPTDAEYARFLEILDRSQGNLLRAFSAAVLPVVQALTIGTPPERGRFKMEDITTNAIAKYPKGSLDFLDLISEMS
ncbi:hypothetical protein HBH49_248420 [Parastagonospora nodorum]|nr:hypothetical protein HBH49_248420 [Parastagonospora nodorum]KAH5289013.1 hypothetical protein HBI11_232790 [Parastagonospora nodorum]KAH5341119.1 hypothetical protein HBI33_239410 [Parastagonospora nodorum]KAH5707214.1 hypothetical protein HBI20_208610 [Parastagonospora nodorum]